MLKKSLLSLAVAASLGVSGCNISSTSGNADADSVKPSGDAGVYPIFNPADGVLPNGIDLVFAAQASDLVPESMKDGTADSGTTDSTTGQPTYKANAITNALDDLTGGISTVAPIDIRFSAAIDSDTVTVGSTVYLVRLPNKTDALNGNLTLPAGMSANTVDQLDLASIAALYPSDDVATATANLGFTATLQPSDDDYQATVISINGGTSNVIRIIPTEPLDAAAKYIVLLTDGIKDTSGDSIQSSPDYKYVKTTPEDELWNPALSGVKSSIGGWELLSTNILGTTLGENVTAENIVFTGGFTTVDPHTVLKSMAYPGYWLENYRGLDSATAGALSGAITGAAYEHPRSRDTALIVNAGGAGVNQIPAASLNSSLSAKVLISQGAIELPQYTQALATDGDDQWTVNDAVATTLDAALSNPAGTTTFPSDLNGEKNVSYRVPFAAEQRKAVVPMILVEPTTTAKATALAAGDGIDGTTAATYDSGCVKPVGGWDTVIFQHGITVDRGGSLAVAAEIAENGCHAVVAIDLPHHGIAPVAGDRDGNDTDNSRLGLGVDYTATDATTTPFAAALSETALDAAIAATQITAAQRTLLESLDERHEGLALTSTNSTAPMTYGSVEAGTAFGASGDFFIRIDNFQRTRDNLQQAVMDLLNLNATIGDIDVDGDGVADLNESELHFVGHSLGAIVGATFVAVNNDTDVQTGNTNLNPIKSLVLATPGGSLPKLLENSVSFKSQLLPNLEAFNSSLVQGNSALEQYMAIFQATVDTADPVNFVGSLATGGSAATNTMIIEMVGGGAVSDTDDARDTLPTSIEALGAYPSDLVVPNNAVGGALADGSVRVETAQTPMAGTDVLVNLIKADHIASDDSTKTHTVIKYIEGTHGTFSSGDAAAAFTEMMLQVVEFVDTDGGTIDVTNTAVLAAPAAQ